MPDTGPVDDTDTERPPGACILHRPPTDGWPWQIADRGYVTCGRCLNKLREHLTDIGARYHRLDATPGATGDGTRGAPGFRSKSPASDHVIALRDPRSSQTARTWRGADGRLHLEDEHPPVPVRSELDTAAWDVAERLDIAGPDDHADVDDLLRWLDVRLDMITRDTVCEDVSHTVRRVLAALKPVTGDPRARRIGSCPCEYAGEVCGQGLFAPVRGDTIRCRACHAEWPRSQWLQLGLALQAGRVAS